MSFFQAPFNLSLLVFLAYQIPLLLSAYWLQQGLKLKDWNEKLIALMVIFCSLVVALLWVTGLSGHLTAGRVFVLSCLVCAGCFFARRGNIFPSLKSCRCLSWSALPWWVLAGWVLSHGFQLIVSSPLGHDSLMYHLYYPFSWLQAGELERIFIPLVQTASVEYYPINGELLYTWCLLPVGHDGFAKQLSWLFLSVLPVLIFTLARQGGAARTPAAWGALAVFVLNPFYFNSCIANTEIILGTFFLAALCLLLRQEVNRGCLFVSGLAMGLSVGCKTLGLFACGAYVVAAVMALGFRHRLKDAWVVLIGLLITGAPAYVRNLIDTGNPLYPTQITLFNTTLFEGPLPMGFFEGHGNLVESFHFFVNAHPLSMTPFTFGLLLLCLPVVLAAGWKKALHRSRVWVLFVTLLVVMALILKFMPLLAQPRQMIPAWMLFSVFWPLALSLCWQRFWFTPLLMFALTGVMMFQTEVFPMVAWGLLASLLCALCVSALAFKQFKIRLLMWVLLLVSANAIFNYRLDLGYSLRSLTYKLIYQDIGEAWEVIDSATAHTPATIAHVSERPYPLLGRHFQNKTLTLPVSASGAEHLHLLNPQGPPEGYYGLSKMMRGPIDAEAWLKRVHDNQVDYLFFDLGERQNHNRELPELTVIPQYPERFTPVYQNSHFVIFKVNQNKKGAEHP